jgi:carbonic anhydrase
MNQSPIDLTGLIEAELAPVQFDYKPGGSEVLNNGHTVQVTYAPGSKITLDGREFELKQFHFHAPSENHIEGRSYPMEGHLVHADKDGNLAVVAVMFEEGAANAALTTSWAEMPEKAGQKRRIAEPVSAEGLLPANRDYYRFNGSLTTPPCSEGVRWLVMKDPVTASKEQIERFAHVMHHPNNRPVQPINARTVLQ